MIRQASAADRDAILRLRTRVFGDVDPEKRDPRFWDWEFSRARVFVDEEVSTHIALVPVPYDAGGVIVNGAIAVDAMTAPEARGRGLYTRAVEAAVEGETLVTATEIRGPALGAMLRAGFVVAERVPVMVRPTFVWRGGLARAPVTRSRSNAEFGHGVILSRGAGPEHSRRDGEGPQHTQFEVLPVRFAHRQDDGNCASPNLANDVPSQAKEAIPHLAEIAAAMPGARVARTHEFLSWRFFENPLWRYDVCANDAAYIVTRRTTLKGYDTLAIVDLAWRDAGAARALVRDAVAEARAMGCTFSAALVSRRHPAFWLLLRHGFIPGPHWFRLLVRPREMARQRWRILWADTDHL